MSSSAHRWRLVHLLLLQMSVLQLLPGGAASELAEHYCRNSPQHTMCTTTGIGSKCGEKVYPRGVSQVDAETIVRTHNNLRAKVAQGNEIRGAPGPQPQAANMLEMTWDEELAMIAQRHADQCVFRHDCCRDVERFHVGQNLYTQFHWNLDHNTNWDHAINAWYYEVDKMSNTGITRFSFSPSTGHYTQLVWGSTYKVGCGYTMYREGNWYKKLYTCNYGPAGNVISTAMYGMGPPCSKCPTGTYCSSEYPGLCGARDIKQTTPYSLVTALNTLSSNTPSGDVSGTSQPHNKSPSPAPQSKSDAVEDEQTTAPTNETVMHAQKISSSSCKELLIEQIV